jgi:hypothetical protein
VVFIRREIERSGRLEAYCGRHPRENHSGEFFFFVSHIHSYVQHRTAPAPHHLYCTQSPPFNATEFPQDRRNNPNPAPSLLQTLLDAKDEEDAGGFTREELSDTLVMFMFAGRCSFTYEAAVMNTSLETG